jgi:hypothetical protein
MAAPGDHTRWNRGFSLEVGPSSFETPALQAPQDEGPGVVFFAEPPRQAVLLLQDEGALQLAFCRSATTSRPHPEEPPQAASRRTRMAAPGDHTQWNRGVSLEAGPSSFETPALQAPQDEGPGVVFFAESLRQAVLILQSRAS